MVVSSSYLSLQHVWLAGANAVLVVACWRATLTALQRGLTRTKACPLELFNQSTSILAEIINVRKRRIFLWIQEQTFLTDQLSAFDRRHRRLVVANQGPTVKLNNRVGVRVTAAIALFGVGLVGKLVAAGFSRSL